VNIVKAIEDKAFAPPVNTARLEGDDLVWFNDLKNQFKVIEPPANETDPVRIKAKDEIRRVIGKNDGDLVGQDLADLETWLLELLPVEDLRQKVNSLRGDWQEMCGEDAWSKILPTLTNQVSTADEKTLRAEARRLQQELHWRASIQPEAQKIRATLMLKVMGMFIAVLIFALLMVEFELSTLGGIVIIAGAMGALISCIQRIQSADLCSSRATSLAKSDRLTLGVTISPMLGGIFAILLVLLLLARQVTPGFVIPDVKVSGPSNFASTNGTNATSESSNAISGTNEPAITGSAASGEQKLAIASANVGKGAGVMSNTGKVQAPGKEIESDVCTYDFFHLKLNSTTGKDLALLILWAFVAGFSERLVPDLLTRLANSKKG
jgi:hypothetical protein